LGAGLGYTLTSIVELGGAIGFNLVNLSTGVTAYDFVLQPFAKINFAEVFHTHNINPFAMFGPVFGFGEPFTGGTTGELGVEGDFGAEFFIGHHWGVTGYVPIGVVFNTAPSATTFTIGLGVGLFGYF
jgi:hypothetical protein